MEIRPPPTAQDRPDRGLDRGLGRDLGRGLQKSIVGAEHRRPQPSDAVDEMLFRTVAKAADELRLRTNWSI
jgi:hypothetical protein